MTFCTSQEEFHFSLTMLKGTLRDHLIFSPTQVKISFISNPSERCHFRLSCHIPFLRVCPAKFLTYMMSWKR